MDKVKHDETLGLFTNAIHSPASHPVDSTAAQEQPEIQFSVKQKRE